MEIREKRKYKRLIPAATAVIAAALLLWLGMTLWGRHRPEFDSDAIDSAKKPLTMEEIQDQIQKEADESGFRFKINTEPRVRTQSNDSTGNVQIADWSITNSIDNICDMSVVITGMDGTEIYRSRQLKPGEQELTGALLTELAPGSHKAEAAAKVLDPETGEVVGNVTAEMTLHVQ